MPFSIKKKWGKKKQKRPIERAFFEPLPYDNDNDCHDDDCLDISSQMGFFGDKGSSQPVYLVSPGNSLVYTKQWRYRDTHYWVLAKRENSIFFISNLTTMTILDRFSLWTKIWPKDEWPHSREWMLMWHDKSIWPKLVLKVASFFSS